MLEKYRKPITYAYLFSFAVLIGLYLIRRLELLNLPSSIGGVDIQTALLFLTLVWFLMAGAGIMQDVEKNKRE